VTDFLKELCLLAGDEALRFFRNKMDAQEKSGHRGLVTEADLACEKLIKAKILERFPQHAILAEESGLAAGSHSQSRETHPLWFIDPIDGTNNFAHGNSYFCISIAYGDSAGRIQAGAVYQPTTQKLFTAERGQGAFCNGERLKLPPITDFSRGSYVTGFGPSHGPALRGVIESIFRVQSKCTSTAVRVNGAAALDLANLARGVYDGFWESTLNPWDTAAGSLLVEEAGGQLLNFNGKPFQVLLDSEVIAGHPAILNELLTNVTGGKE
jgi:myo-inositol-1(or 4)-monophosphatase